MIDFIPPKLIQFVVLLTAISPFVYFMLYLAERFCSDGNKNPKNPNRYMDLSNLSKKELIALINKEREDIVLLVRFLDNLDIHEMSDRNRAFELMVIKIIIKYFLGRSRIL